ncbi:hypothetical protein U9R90_25135 [Streptomyces sp. E11-3]|uniref:hypothetical protein n=1 Tax=Streptomyces sp. E11-3 TaxID=3110112 RepID=UPI00397FC690
MITKTTHLAAQVSAPKPRTLGEQAPAVHALSALVETFGDLPSPHVSLYSVGAPHLPLQLQSPEGFEAWRTALQIAPDTVVLKSFEGTVWLAANGVFDGVPVELTGYGLALSPAVVEAAQAVAE